MWRARLSARQSLGLRLGRRVKQQRTELFGGITHAISADVNQGQPFKHLSGLHKRILSSPQQGQQFIERLRAAAGTDLQLGIERMLALPARSTQIVGTPNADRTE